MTRIVYTRPGGLVSILAPSSRCIAAMGSGGRWPTATRGWLSTQVERHIANGVAEDTASRFVSALAFGGCVTAEALCLIAAKDARPFGTGIELWSVQDVSANRWFRAAWRRQEGGGPIWIDLPAARLIQLRRAEQAVGRWNKTAGEEDDKMVLAGRLTNGPAFIEFDRRRFRDRLLAAATPEQIRAVWPEELRREQG